MYRYSYLIFVTGYDTVENLSYLYEGMGVTSRILVCGINDNDLSLSECFGIKLISANELYFLWREERVLLLRIKFKLID